MSPLCWRQLLVFDQSLKRAVVGEESTQAFGVFCWTAVRMAEGMILNKPGLCASCCPITGGKQVAKSVSQINNKTCNHKIEQRKGLQPTWIPENEASWCFFPDPSGFKQGHGRAEGSLDPTVASNIQTDSACSVSLLHSVLLLLHHNLSENILIPSSHIYQPDQLQANRGRKPQNL